MFKNLLLKCPAFLLKVLLFLRKCPAIIIIHLVILAPGQVWTGAENLVPHLYLIPARPARSGSLSDSAILACLLTISNKLVYMLICVGGGGKKERTKSFPCIMQ